MTTAAPSSVLIRNARIYVRASAPTPTEAILLTAGRVAATGLEAERLADTLATVEILDLAGRTILPGLCDAHLHLEMYARSLAMVDCETSKEECLRRVQARARQLKHGSWILGHGWNQNDWGGHGTAAELDSVAPDHPVYLTAKSLHAAWANSAALLLAGVHSSTPDLPGGALVRDASGAPTGVLLEGAMALVADQIPPPSVEVVAEEILAAQEILWQFGITAVHDFDGPRCFQALQVLHAERRLGLHVLKSIPLDQLEHAASVGLRGGFGDDWLRIGHLKIFADGALGPRTAAMLHPYADEPGNMGIELLDREGLLEVGMKAARLGLPLAVHAIGDRANHEVLEGFAALRAFEGAEGLPALRHRIEHLQLVHFDDVARPAELDVIASMQPIHATSDMPMAIRAWGDRNRYAYAWRSQLDHGAMLAFGSDAPVDSPNPFLGLHAAVTRRRLDGSPSEDGWISEQRLSLAEALDAFTTAPARTAGYADRVGQLLPGFYADLIVLEKDPFTVPPGSLATISPLATMVAGEWVFRSES